MRRKIWQSNKLKLGALGLLVAALVIQLSPISISVQVPKGMQPLTIGYGQHTLTIGTKASAAGTLDYTVDGVADNVQFTQAIAVLNAVGGGEIIALSGNYSWAAVTTVNVPANITIRGTGNSTYFAGDGATALFTATGNNVALYDFRTDAGGISMGATTGWQWINVNNGVTAYDFRTPSGSIVNGAFTASSVTDSGLTSGRVVTAGVAGLLQGSADFTVSGSTTTMTTANITTSYFGTSLMNLTHETFSGWDTSVATVYDSLKISGNPGLKARFYNDARFSIWDTATFGSGPPKNPADGDSFAFSVYGDILAGDYNTWTESVPGSGTFAGLQLGRRIGNNITDITKTTNIYSNVDIGKDNSGGASITLTPDATGAINSGVLQLVAFGQGTGSLANTIQMATRNAANTTANRMIVSSSNVTIVDGVDLMMNGSVILDDTGANLILQNIRDIWANGTNINFSGIPATAGVAGSLYYVTTSNITGNPLKIVVMSP